MTKRSGAAAIGAMALFAVGYWWHGRAPANVSAPSGSDSAVPVTVVEAQRRDVLQRIPAIGTVQSLHTVVLRPQVSGTITEVLFEEGELVERGELMARIDARAIKATLAQMQAEKVSSEADLRIAELDLARYDGLRDRSIVSRQTIEQQAALVEKLKAAIRASEARIEAQRVQLSFTEIRSPVRGRVGIRRLDPGNLVQVGDEQGLVTVTQVAPISIVFTVPQEMLPRLRHATQASRRMRVTAFDRDGGEPVAHGTLTTLDNQIDVATGTLRLRAEFDNQGNELWPGQFVSLQLETGASTDATVLPAQAIQQGMEGPFVYRVEDALARAVPVITSYLDDEIAVIASGVAVGELIVIDGQSRLRPGARVKPSIPAASSKGASGDVAGT